MPIIGIPTMERNNKNQFYVPEKYVLAVRHAGGLPLLYPPGGAGAAAFCDAIDGLLLMGGGDILPSRYQQTNRNLAFQLSEERDESEFQILKEAVKRRMPILGICRGMQLINVFFGGELHQDLTDSGFEQDKHGSVELGFIEHSVQVNDGTLLARILGQQSVSVMSKHHQCLSRLGDGLVASAYAPDGIVEAIEHPSYPWLLGVQWHPEQRDVAEMAHQGLFNQLVMAADASQQK